MIQGKFTDGHPRAVLTLPTNIGEETVEFIIDTGFNGDLAIPDTIARRLVANPAGFTVRQLADGSLMRVPRLEMSLPDDFISRDVEIIVLPGNPLIGTTLLTDHLLQIEVAEGGDVFMESL